MAPLIRFLPSVHLRRRTTPALVRVDGAQIWIDLSTQPPVGATLDVGFPVVVTASRQVAGGGMLIAAQRAEERSRSESRVSADGR